LLLQINYLEKSGGSNFIKRDDLVVYLNQINNIIIYELNDRKDKICMKILVN